MVQVNVTRIAVEVLANSDPQVAITKQDLEVAVGANIGASQVKVTRIAVEVLGNHKAKIAITKQDLEIAVAGNVGAARVNVSRIGIEVIASVIKKIAITKQDLEIAVAARVGASQVKVSRIGVEVLSRQHSIIVSPLALDTRSDLFMHNWASSVSMEAAYSTDVSISAVTGAESRRGQSEKPARTLTINWTRNSVTDIDRLLVRLRRMTEARVQVPLYQDQTDVTVQAASSQPVLLLNTTQARFFPGARVAVVHLDHAAQVTAVEYYLISKRTDTQLTFTTNITSTIEVGAVVFPLLDVNIVLEPRATWSHGRLIDITLDVEEVEGASQLPTVQSDNPDTFTVYRDAPIFSIDPNWGSTVSRGYSRQGEKYTRGRARVTYVAADRARLTEEFAVSGDRATAWRIIRFFGTRRGRLRSFWAVDQEELWTVQTAGGFFIEVNKQGDFTEFQVALLPGYIGIVMEDGTEYVREVNTVQDLVSSWRVTLIEAIPTLDPAAVVRFTRGRRVRLTSDAMTENWTNTNYFATSWSTVEVLNEGDFSL